MPSEIFTHLSATAEAAAAKVAEAESAGAVARKLLDELSIAAGTATRTLPPDTSYREVRRYVDERGRAMVEIEVDLDDDLVAFLDTVPDRNAFIEEAIGRCRNASTLGRHAYYQRLNAAAAEFGLRAPAGPALDAWMDNHPEAPQHLTTEILTAHGEWLGRQPQSPHAPTPAAPNATTGGTTADGIDP